jgi:hypothetical protein
LDFISSLPLIERSTKEREKRAVVKRAANRRLAVKLSSIRATLRPPLGLIA